MAWAKTLLLQLDRRCKGYYALEWAQWFCKKDLVSLLSRLVRLHFVRLNVAAARWRQFHICHLMAIRMQSGE
jgi:hypothetical protein